MTISLEALIVIALIVVVAIFAVRILAWLIGLLVLGLAVVIGLAIASDLVTGGHALEQLAQQLVPIAASIAVAIGAWIKSKGQGSDG